MFYVVSKIVWYSVEPINFLLIIGLVGVALGFGRFKRAGRVATSLAILLLAVASFSPLGSLVLRPIEDRFPQPPVDLPAPAGIIVLGGALDEGITAARQSPALLQAGTRLTGTFVLSRRFPLAPIIFTGGGEDAKSQDRSEAEFARDVWLSLGLAPERIRLETKSKNTWENALFTRDLLQPKPGDKWLLVTSAWHMPRAMGIFRRVGFDVVPYPVDYRTYGNRHDWRPTYVVLDELTNLDLAMHEWIGLTAYYFTGKTDAWFPGP